MEGKIFVTTCTVNHGDRVSVNCQKKQITQKQLDVYAEQLKDYLLKIDYTRTRSYDNSDDDRVSDSYSSWNSVKYCEIDVANDSEYLIVDGDSVIGVVFVVSENNGSKDTRVFLFNGEVEQRMSLGYSASHSSEWTYVNKVTLVKRGENGAPQEGNSIDFSQSRMYPSI